MNRMLMTSTEIKVFICKKHNVQLMLTKITLLTLKEAPCRSEKLKKLKKLNEKIFCHVIWLASGVAQKRQTTWDLSRKNWKKEN